MPLALDATFVTCRSALVTTGVTTVAVLFPGTGSGVVLVPAALLVTLPVLAVTVAVTTTVIVPPTASVADVAVTPLVEALTNVPPVTTGVPSVNPALATSVNVTFCATDGPRFTSVTV